jgi:hypothetical protein
MQISLLELYLVNEATANILVVYNKIKFYQKKTGHFMLFDASRGVKNDIARLISPTETISSGRSCLEFYYNAYG